MNQPETASSLPPVLHSIHKAAVSRKAGDPVAMDLQPLTPFTDYFYICHSDSRPQSEAIVDAITRQMSKDGFKGYHVEGSEASEWVLIDASEVIVHIFLTAQRREFYSLERLWADAERVELPELPSDLEV